MADQFPRLSGPARGARVDFTRLFEASPARCLVLTPDLEITAVTDSYLAATMTRREEIVGRRLFDVFPDNPADPAATGVANLRRSLETVLATGRAHTMAIQKYDIRRPESEGGEFEERYWSPVNSPVLGPDGRVALIIHTVEDVTERIKRERADAEHARKADEFRTQVDRMESEIDLRSRELGRVNASLRDSEDHLRLALAAGRIGTWRWDLRNDTVLLSERAWEVLGSPPDRTDAAATYRDAVHPDDRERVMATVARSIETGAVYDQEYRCVLHDGSVRWVAARGHVFRDEHGRPSVMQGVVLDITERNAAEALRGQKLEHERAAAEEASRAKSMFLAHMSHELRTPLNGVIGMIELLLGGNLGGRERRYAEITRASAQSLTSIINDILDFSKIEAGHLELIEVEFDVHTLLDDVVQMMALPARQKGLELACHCDADVPRVVRGDPDRLRQIVVNLVNNAIKFTASGSVVMRAVLDRREGEGVMVRVSVTDTGIGIPADRLDRLFKAFSQADSFTTRTYGGTGLGLAISKRLAELMGGGIGVESERGKGSTFWFTVMLRAPEEAGRGAVRSVDARGLRVLAVDASEVHREILGSQLASSGFEASSVTDGHAALRALSECADSGRPFRVAIIDKDVRGIDAFELAAEVRRRPGVAGTVLMILLAVDDSLEPDRARAMGFHGVMSKPVKQSQLFDAIMDAIGRSTVAPVLTASAGAARSGASGPALPAGLRVLVAEDNEVNQIVVGEILRTMGVEFEIAADGQRAVEAARSGRFDAVLMDCQMPLMDGFEATRAIRSAEGAGATLSGRGGRLPIVALTANAMAGDRERCLGAGMDWYTSKPINPDELRRALARVLVGGAGGGGPAAGASAAGDGAEPFSCRALLEWCRPGTSSAMTALDKFEEQLRADLVAIEGELERGDTAELARLGHRLRGSASLLRADDLSRVALTLEDAARERRLDAARVGLSELRAQVQRCLDYVPTARRLAAARLSEGGGVAPLDGAGGR